MSLFNQRNVVVLAGYIIVGVAVGRASDQDGPDLPTSDLAGVPLGVELAIDSAALESEAAQLKELEAMRELMTAIREFEEIFEGSTAPDGLESPLGDEVRTPGGSERPPSPWDQTGESMLDRARALRGGERGAEQAGEADRFTRLGWVSDGPPSGSGFTRLSPGVWGRTTDSSITWWFDEGDGDFVIIDVTSSGFEIVVVEDDRVTDRGFIPHKAEGIELDPVVIGPGGRRAGRGGEDETDGESPDGESPDGQPSETDTGRRWHSPIAPDPWRDFLAWYTGSDRPGPYEPGDDFDVNDGTSTDPGTSRRVGLNAVVNPELDNRGRGGGGGSPYNPRDPFPIGPDGDSANTDDPFGGYSSEDLAALASEGAEISAGFVLVPPGGLAADAGGTGSDPAGSGLPGFTPVIGSGMSQAAVGGLPNGGLFRGPSGLQDAPRGGPNGGR